MTTKQQYDQYKTTMQKIADVKYSNALLQWDQETYMPTGAANVRARQLATLSEIAHEMSTTANLGDLLTDLLSKDDLSAEEKFNVKQSHEDYFKQKKYTSVFVRELSEATSAAFNNWVKARNEDDFSLFENDLNKLIELKLQEADLLGYQNHPYNALLNEYDKGATVAQNDLLFEALKKGLIPIVEKIKAQPQVNDDFLKQHFPKDQQWQLGIEVLKIMGYDFTTGRQDIAAHPFTINFGSTDVRVTTRIDENDFSNMLFSCIHEGGHALYEQGLLDENYGLPMGEYSSLVVHESQSRLWENHMGKSLEFWQHYYLELVKRFPKQLQQVDVNSFYKGINKVIPSLIRTEADEVTYHFHVMIRYGIEKLLLTKQIKAKDIPAIWNELYKNLLGVIVPSNANGCLQDVHWSHGSFGYFSTYSMGTMMAAQLFQSFENQYESNNEYNYENKIRKILFWLRENVHIFGKAKNTNELCISISGENLNVRYLLDYLTKKYLAHP
jgi:carboxypeptidase Taq